MEPRRSQAARSQAARDQIVQAALTVFALKGYAAAGLASLDPLEDYTLLFRSGPTGPFTDLGLAGLVSGSTVAFDLLGFNQLDDGFYAIAVVPEPSPAIVIAGVALSAVHRRRRDAHLA